MSITFVKVKVEVKTSNVKESNKRIDILIETNLFVIAIEFKINHELNNPLQVYKDFVEKEFSSKKRIYTVLTPDRKAPKNEASKFYCNHPDYPNFFQKVYNLTKSITVKEKSFEGKVFSWFFG